MNEGAIHGTKINARYPAIIMAGMLKITYKALAAINLTRLDQPEIKNRAKGPLSFAESSKSITGSLSPMDYDHLQ